MTIDLTVASIPVYFGTMAAEQRWLAKRADERGATPADYTREDTLASLSMGIGSLLVPLATESLLRRFVPGEGKYPKLLLRTALAGAAITTLADHLVRTTEHRETEPREPQHRDVTSTAPRRTRRRRSAVARRWAQRVARVGGVTTVAAGTLAASTAFSTKLSPQRMWRKGEKHDLGSGPLPWFIAIVGWDFIYYWNHRFMHEVRALWALHVVHHSSERYNLSTALRQPVADSLAVWIPYGVMSRFGIRPHMVVQARAINLLYQYWIHTDVIGRLHRAVETVFNTPSHHRAHHGSNRQYLDRNHGSILIVWDRLFGTFEPEREPVNYGLTTNIETHNPLRIATHEYRDILADVAGSTTWRDRLSFVLRGPGWAYERHRERHESTELVAA